MNPTLLIALAGLFLLSKQTAAAQSAAAAGSSSGLAQTSLLSQLLTSLTKGGKSGGGGGGSGAQGAGPAAALAANNPFSPFNGAGALYNIEDAANQSVEIMDPTSGIDATAGDTIGGYQSIAQLPTNSQDFVPGNTLADTTGVNGFDLQNSDFNSFDNGTDVSFD